MDPSWKDLLQQPIKIKNCPPNRESYNHGLYDPDYHLYDDYGSIPSHHLDIKNIPSERAQEMLLEII